MKPLVLLSGGLDSAVALASTYEKLKADDVDDDGPIHTLCFGYGQHHIWERGYAYKLARHYGTSHKEIDLPRSIFGDAGIMAAMSEIPKTAADAIVPFRNGILFAIAVCQAEQMGCDCVVVATHGYDSDFYDTQFDFIQAFGAAVRLGTMSKVALTCPVQDMVKSEIVALGAALGVPFELTRSCYVSERGCGACMACRIRAEAFAANDLKDPAISS